MLRRLLLRNFTNYGRSDKWGGSRRKVGETGARVCGRGSLGTGGGGEAGTLEEIGRMGGIGWRWGVGTLAEIRKQKKHRQGRVVGVWAGARGEGKRRKEEHVRAEDKVQADLRQGSRKQRRVLGGKGRVSGGKP